MRNRQEAEAAKSSRVEPSERLDDFARRVIGAAIEVHRHLGPGFSEGVYEEALAVELKLRGIPFVRQPAVEVQYKGHRVGIGRPDFLVGDILVVELKAITALTPSHQAQVISYLKSMRTQLGLLLNFKEAMMRNGIRRVVWTRAPSYRQHQTSDVNKSHEASERLVVSGCDTPVALEVVEEDLDSIA
jgi:GxxExxY protein